MIDRFVTPSGEYTGWEIAPECLINLQKLIALRDPCKLDIIEFGSGKSTDLLYKFQKENNLSGVLDSFDADPSFAHPLAKIRKIKSYDNRPIQFGTDYSFYDLSESDFSSDNYNLVVLDGHHGHGRSVAWKYLKHRLANRCLVLIDDYDHYPFVEDFLQTFPAAVLLDKHWEDTKRWVIYEVI